MAESRNYQQPTVEDGSDDEIVFARRNSPNSPERANITAKRSNPSNLNNAADKTTDKAAGLDVASDSGYSSHTAATTVSSADSAQSQKSSQSPPVVRATPQEPSTPRDERRRRPTISDERKNSSYGSPRKPLSRTASTARKPKNEREAECDDPNCDCQAKQRQRRPKPRPSPLDSGLDLSNCPPFDARSQRSDPSQYTPTSPQASRRPPIYPQHSYVNGSAVVTPASSGRRRSSSVARPTSYHGEPPQSYWVPGMPYPTPPQDHGPPPSMSAHWNNTMYGATPPNQVYPGYPQQISPPYEQQRPQMPTRNSSQYSTRGARPISHYGAPVLSYDQPHQSSSNVSAQRLPSARVPDMRPPPPRAVESSSEEEDESSEEDERRGGRAARERDMDRALMPPPVLKTSKQSSQRRPSLHRPYTTQGIDPRMTQSQMLPEREPDRGSRSSRPSRSSSIRPALVQQAKATSYEHPERNARVIVETPRDKRRQSYMGYESHNELKEKHRQVYYEDEGPRSRRRQTDVDTRRRDEKVTQSRHRQSMSQNMSQNMSSAEAHMRQARGDFVPEVTEQDVKSARRSSRVISGGSESGSGRSKHSDKASRVSRAPTSVSQSQSGEIRLRVDTSSGANIQMNGDMEGRTIALNPTSNGMVDIVIGGSRGDETMYRSERGSQAGKPRAIMPRREAEEMSVKSRHSSHSRRGEDRDRDRNLLRRRRPEDY